MKARIKNPTNVTPRVYSKVLNEIIFSCEWNNHFRLFFVRPAMKLPCKDIALCNREMDIPFNLN